MAYAADNPPYCRVRFPKWSIRGAVAPAGRAAVAPADRGTMRCLAR